MENSGGHVKVWRTLGGLLLGVIFASSAGLSVDYRWGLDLETGLVISGYNDVRIPGDSGTLLSLSEELDTDESFFARGWLEYRLAERHTIGLLVAPLRLYARGSVDREVTFEGRQFPAGAPLEAVYEFNSYRVTYRYDIYRARHLKACIGVTAKIRDALVRLESSGQIAEKTNVGFVPLFHFGVVWSPWDRLSLMVGGDALAAPQGRAEDVLCAVRYSINPNMGVKVGYRLLEGGADVAEVYSFALLHYVVLGVDVRL